MQTVPQREVCNFTHAGIRPENQDTLAAYTAADDSTVRHLNRGELFLVVDGMGGHRSGREAVLELSRRIFEHYYGPRLDIPDFMNSEGVCAGLKHMLATINQTMLTMGQDDVQRSNWGCTASVLLIRPDWYYWVHVGDTRLYRLRDGQATLLTEDQNVAWQMYKYKQVTYEEYLSGAGHNKLLSFVGQGDDISIRTGHAPLAAGDVFLLCSDGLNQFLEYQAMLDWLEEQGRVFQSPPPADVSASPLPAADAPPTLASHICRQLIDTVIQPEQAEDNVTFMVVAP